MKPSLIPRSSVIFVLIYVLILVFTELHSMQGGLVVRKVSIHLSDCLSIKRVDTTKRKKNLNTKDHVAYISKKNGTWGATPSTWNFGSTSPRWSEMADFKPILAPCFPMRPRWPSYVGPKLQDAHLVHSITENIQECVASHDLPQHAALIRKRTSW